MVSVTVKSKSEKGYQGITRLLINEKKELSTTEKLLGRQMFTRTVSDTGTVITVTYAVKSPMVARYLTSDVMKKPLIEALEAEKLVSYIDYELE